MKPSLGLRMPKNAHVRVHEWYYISSVSRLKKEEEKKKIDLPTLLILRPKGQTNLLFFTSNLCKLSSKELQKPGPIFFFFFWKSLRFWYQNRHIFLIIILKFHALLLLVINSWTHACCIRCDLMALTLMHINAPNCSCGWSTSTWVRRIYVRVYARAKTDWVPSSTNAFTNLFSSIIDLIPLRLEENCKNSPILLIWWLPLINNHLFLGLAVYSLKTAPHYMYMYTIFEKDIPYGTIAQWNCYLDPWHREGRGPSCWLSSTCEFPSEVGNELPGRLATKWSFLRLILTD